MLGIACKTTMNLLLVVLLQAAIWSTNLVTAASTDPANYFGGSNHEPYLDWLEPYGDEYDRHLFLASSADPSEGVALHWRIQEDRLYMAVAARAEGWVGFGLSESGGMQGSDVVLFVKDQPDQLTDSHILQDYAVPEVDDCQDWTLIRSFTDNGFLIFEGHRALDTGDTQDRRILPDPDQVMAPGRVIAAWGNEPDGVAYHGPVNRARSAVRWTDEDPDPEASFTELMAETAEGYFDVRANNHTIKAEDTEYAYFCFSRSNITDQGMPPDWENLLAIGFEPIIDPNSARHVHHFIVYGSSEPFDNEACDFRQFYTMAYGWAPGEPSFAMPPEAGAPLGAPDGFQSFMMEIHYDNPEELGGVVDNSGIRFYYTSQPREHKAGVLMLGDPLVTLGGEPVGEGIMEHSFACPGECSAFALGGTEPVTVVREYLHMHQSGVAMRNEQFRDGQLIRTGHADFFNFDQQGSQVVEQEPFQVLPGDAFRTVCQYNATNGELFGLSSQEEMCIAFLFYYPIRLVGGFPWICAHDIPFPACSEAYESRQLEQVENRTFGLSNPDGMCPAGSIPMTQSSADPTSDSTMTAKIGNGFFAFASVAVLIARLVM